MREGVDTVFGYPGGAVLHIYDELARMPNQLRHILARHEQGAVHMAEGYAKATGRVGVVLVTSGPGATNAVAGNSQCFHGLDTAGGNHWPSAAKDDRYRCVSGN